MCFVIRHMYCSIIERKEAYVNSYSDTDKQLPQHCSCRKHAMLLALDLPGISAPYPGVDVPSILQRVGYACLARSGRPPEEGLVEH